MSRRRRGRVASAALALIALAGCGYRLAGGNAFLPERIRAVMIVSFENRTGRPEIEQRVTEEVARQLAQRGRYRLVLDPGAADAMLEGAITSYSTAPVQFSAQGLANRVEAMVTMQATLRELATDEVLWSQGGLVFREQFDIAEGEEFFDEESLALDDIARGAAGALVNAILEGF